jgi:aspartate/methionine/tyrosine aminotransferase
MLREIAEIAKNVDAYVLCDEVYRGLTQEEGYSKSIVDIYEKGISVSSMSKVFSLAGLRLGWVAASEDVIAKCFEHRDYNMISCGMLDETFAGLALKNADRLLERNKSMVRRNLVILDKWVSSEPHICYVKPQAGTTALLYYDFEMSSRDFCVNLMKKHGVLLTPGSCFELEKCARIGYACSTDILEQGLEKLSEHLKTIE